MLENAVDEAPDKIRVVRVNIDKNEEAADDANILTLPAVHFWVGGSQVGGLTGKLASSRLGFIFYFYFVIICNYI